MVGMTEAILLQHFFYWHQHAQNLPEMNREGRVWFYRSVAEMREVFPYLSDGNVRTAIQHLIDRGLIVKGDFASSSMYKATWYSLNDSAIQLFHLSNSANAFVESQNGFSETTKSKYCRNKDISKSNRKENNNISRFDFRSALLGLGVSEETADTWMEVRRRAKAVNSELAFKDLCSEIAKTGQSAEECIRLAAVNSWRGFKAEYIRPKETPNPRPFPQQGRKPSVYEKNAAAWEEFERRLKIQHADEQ